MYRLAYVSTADEAVSSSDLQDIIEAAIRNNARDEVSGILLFNGASFLQVLEGPQKAVEAAYARICHDDRHRHIVTIFRESGTRRNFEETPMALKTLASDRAELPDGLTLSRDLNLSLPAGLPAHLRNMLLTFDTARL